MRCICCNVLLTAFESTVRSAKSEEFLDMCERCLTFYPSQVITREDLRRELGTDFALYSLYSDIDEEGSN